MVCGTLLLWWLNHSLPHEHFVSGPEGPDTETVRRIWLFVLAITIHNLPEGMAVGVGFGGGDTARGVSLATGIGLQNVPEGLAVAASLVSVGFSRTKAALVALGTGLLEPLGGLLGSAAVALVEPLMPWTLGFAAGAMLYVISDEIIPETHKRGYDTQATFALVAGLVLMMTLDHALG